MNIKGLSGPALERALQAAERIEYDCLTASIEAGNGSMRHSEMVTAYMAGTLNAAGRASLDAWEKAKSLRDERNARLKWHGTLRPIRVQS